MSNNESMAGSGVNGWMGTMVGTEVEDVFSGVQDD